MVEWMISGRSQVSEEMKQCGYSQCQTNGQLLMLNKNTRKINSLTVKSETHMMANHEQKGMSVSSRLKKLL